MRQIGTLDDESRASAFVDYLLTQGIGARVLDERAGGWGVWVHRDEQLEQARSEFVRFEANPSDPRYWEAGKQAAALRKQAQAIDREHSRHTHDLRGRIGSPLGSSTGRVTFALIAISVVATLFLWFARDLGDRWLFFTLYGFDLSSRRFVDAGFEPIREGQVWRLITPIFIHLSVLHLFFNMAMLRAVGTLIENRQGPWLLLALVVVIGVAANIAQYIWPEIVTLPAARRSLGNVPFGGMSGVLYGLFGFCWVRGSLDPASGLRLPNETVVSLLVWLVLCMTGLLGPIANTAHMAGLICGAMAGAATSRRP